MFGSQFGFRAVPGGFEYRCRNGTTYFGRHITDFPPGLEAREDSHPRRRFDRVPDFRWPALRGFDRRNSRSIPRPLPTFEFVNSNIRSPRPLGSLRRNDRPIEPSRFERVDLPSAFSVYPGRNQRNTPPSVRANEGPFRVEVNTYPDASRRPLRLTVDHESLPDVRQEMDRSARMVS